MDDPHASGDREAVARAMFDAVQRSDLSNAEVYLAADAILAALAEREWAKMPHVGVEEYYAACHERDAAIARADKWAEEAAKLGARLFAAERERDAAETKHTEAVHAWDDDCARLTASAAAWQQRAEGMRWALDRAFSWTVGRITASEKDVMTLRLDLARALAAHPAPTTGNTISPGVSVGCTAGSLPEARVEVPHPRPFDDNGPAPDAGETGEGWRCTCDAPQSAQGVTYHTFDCLWPKFPPAPAGSPDAAPSRGTP